MSDIERRVKEVVVRTLDVDPGRVTENAHFVRDLGATSIQSIELVAAFEEEFDIEMEEDKAREVQTVGEAVEFIAQYVPKD